MLDPGEVILDEGRVRVLGCTLWTDFELPVRVGRCGASAATHAVDRKIAMSQAGQYMNDYRVIAVAQRRRQPEDTRRIRRQERAWLLEHLREPFAGTTVVVTHHAPSAASVAERCAADWMTPAFVSNLPDEFFKVPSLWVHDHTHTSFDYRRGRTRVICNPRGYVQRNGSNENDRFDPRLIIDTDDSFV